MKNRNGNNNQLDDDSILKELRKIQDRTGRLTAELIVNTARDPKHLLHGQFEWDNSIAGEQWRIVQARRLIRRVETIYVVNNYEIRTVAYVRDPSVDPADQGYRSVIHLAKEPDDARVAVLAEFGRVAAYLKRARDVSTALGYADEIERILNRVMRLRNRIEKDGSDGSAPNP
jgi:hypothetical protein